MSIQVEISIGDLVLYTVNSQDQNKDFKFY